MESGGPFGTMFRVGASSPMSSGIQTIVGTLLHALHRLFGFMWGAITSSVVPPQLSTSNGSTDRTDYCDHPYVVEAYLACKL